MASFPVSLPSLGSVASGGTVNVADFNARNDEIEAIAAELGTNPKTINDATTVDSSNTDVADYLDKLATIAKAIAGVSHWYEAAVPSRNVIAFHGGGNATAGTGSNARWVGWGSLVTNANRAQAQIVVPFTGKVRVRGCFVETLNTHGDGLIQFVLSINGGPADGGNNLILCLIPPEAPAGKYYYVSGGANDYEAMDFSAGGYVGLWFSDSSSVPATQIGSVTVEFDQVG
jgi:hypothetical protein